MKEDVNRQQVGSGGLKEGIPLPLPISVRGHIFFITLTHIYFIFLLAREESSREYTVMIRL